MRVEHAHAVSSSQCPCRSLAGRGSFPLPTRPLMATDGEVGPPGRSPKGLFRLVHN
jgi:hypothetical protein